MSEKLPDGWAKVRLGDILTAIEVGKSFTCEPRRAEPDEWAIIKVSAMTWGSFDETENKALPAHRHPDFRFEIKPGDILVSRANTEAYVGAPVLVGQCRPRLLLSDKSLRLVPSDEIDRRWLVYSLASPAVRKQISAKSTGAQESMRNISQQALADIEIPLPPLAEQQRIVEMLDGHLSRLDAAVANITAANQKLNPLREILFKKLVNPEEIPGGWRRTPLGDLVKMGSGGTPKSGVRSYYGGAIPWAVSGDLDDSVLTDVAGRITESGYQSSSAKLVPAGAVLIAMYGATIGKLGVTGCEMTTNQAIAHLIPNDCTITASYLFWYLRSQRASFVRAGKGGAQPNISQTVLKGWPILVPPTEEQSSIVEHLEIANAMIVRMQSDISRNIRRSTHLRRALLDQAFSGALTPQNPADEPASTLLKRIELERGGQQKPARARRNTTAKKTIEPPMHTSTVPVGIQEELPL